ncbi:hypothetical protein M9H77_14688 [Catharanthus roseus]|uniref:Uncharacterized protein n=1 Tax=Catharanthus roseus TaxID=4058 RepID=A0ACC0BNY0_CATRO|nr:hypothetical protein M9H77_14688 [Catharanthus roseus]
MPLNPSPPTTREILVHQMHHTKKLPLKDLPSFPDRRTVTHQMQYILHNSQLGSSLIPLKHNFTFVLKPSCRNFQRIPLWRSAGTSHNYCHAAAAPLSTEPQITSCICLERNWLDATTQNLGTRPVAKQVTPSSTTTLATLHYRVHLPYGSRATNNHKLMPPYQLVEWDTPPPHAATKLPNQQLDQNRTFIPSPTSQSSTRARDLYPPNMRGAIKFFPLFYLTHISIFLFQDLHP